jgi:hypothetical protein
MCPEPGKTRKRRGFPRRLAFGFLRLGAFSSEVDIGSREENASKKK